MTLKEAKKHGMSRSTFYWLKTRTKEKKRIKFKRNIFLKLEKDKN